MMCAFACVCVCVCAPHEKEEDLLHFLVGPQEGNTIKNVSHLKFVILGSDILDSVKRLCKLNFTK